ncbi:MAG: site-specific DNA-methyltransferase [Ekhidna sp.]|nr:site-specific DNA-methyltransferase [Ekhidna sp.]
MKSLSDSSIDLIYLAPPFNNKRTYNIMYKNMTGNDVPEQIEAFCDTWDMDAEKQELLDNMVVTMKHSKMDADFMALWDMCIKALRQTRRDLTAYLLYMTVRLLEMRRLLKHTGSIYLHCDLLPAIIKVLMDGIFGHKNFRNEIFWGYRTGGVSKKHFPRKYDVIMNYGISKKTYHNAIVERLYHEKPFLLPKQMKKVNILQMSL